MDPWFTKKRVKHGSEKMVWEMITAQGVGHIVCIEGNLNKELYCEILQDNVLGTYHDLHLDYHDYYFQLSRTVPILTISGSPLSQMPSDNPQKDSTGT